MKKFVIAGLAVVAFAAHAFAADMPVKAPAYNPPAAYNWTGFYVGVNAGYGRSAWNDQLGDLSNGAPNLFSGLSPKGFIGGGQIGYNWQFAASPLVLGIEADFQGSSIKDSVTWGTFPATSTSEATWFGTVRGRIGYAWNTWLLYATGGWAYGHVNNSETFPVILFSSNRNSSGYALGAGVEHAIMPGWSVKGEYQYINLGTSDPTNQFGAHFASFTGTTLHADSFHTVRLGLNYKFMPW